MKKKQVNRKSFLSVMTILLMIILIVVITWYSAGLDPSYWKSKEFLSDMLIQAMIGIFSIVSGYGFGDNYFRTKVDGLFVYTYNEYDVKRKEIDIYLDKFKQWNEKLYRKEYAGKIRDYLLKHGIEQYEVILKLDRKQVLMLVETQKFIIDDKEVYIKSLTDEQIKAVLKVMDGKIKMPMVNEGYFLHAYAKSGKNSNYERAGKQDVLQRNTFIGMMGYKLLMSMAISFILAGLIIEPKESVSSEVITKMISRLFTMFTAITWGFYTGNEMVKKDTVFLSYKTQVLATFKIEVENGTFVPQSIEELAMQEYANKLLENNGKMNNEDTINNDST